MHKLILAIFVCGVGLFIFSCLRRLFYAGDSKSDEVPPD
jgi:hypothetical protein